MNPDSLETRVNELDNNPELTSQEIFNAVCREFSLDANSLAQELDCECPFALAGFIGELTASEISQYSFKSDDY